MKAMILAGGLSTRLYPLTKEVPKPVIPVAGEPISGHVMRWLASFGLRDVAINVFYLAEAVRAAFGDGSRYGVRLTYLDERELTGSAGALKQMEPWFADGTFVVVGCDDLTDADLGALVAFHKERGALATIGLLAVDEVDQYGVVILDEHGRITGFQEKPAKGTEKSKLANTGIYVFEPAIFDAHPGRHVLRFRQAGVSRAGRGRLAVLRHGAARRVLARRRHAGRVPPGQRRRARRARRAGRRPRHRRARERARRAGRANRRRGPRRRRRGDRGGARIVGPSVIGDGARVGAGATVERSIVWNGARIGAGATAARRDRRRALRRRRRHDAGRRHRRQRADHGVARRCRIGVA